MSLQQIEFEVPGMGTITFKVDGSSVTATRAEQGEIRSPAVERVLTSEEGTTFLQSAAELGLLDGRPLPTQEELNAWVGASPPVERWPTFDFVTTIRATNESGTTELRFNHGDTTTMYFPAPLRALYELERHVRYGLEPQNPYELVG